MEGSGVNPTGQKRLAAKNQSKDLEPMTAVIFGKGEKAVVVAGQVQDGRQIKFKELFGNGPGTGKIKPPLGTIGQDTPAQLA
jgi:hypothetical protein